jgi:tetratricopeptide (TPR) repeat protein
MTKTELKKQLSTARFHREYGQYPEALAILHQVVNEYPEDKYYYLLASTYFESGEQELALEYADKTLEINISNKETYELKGLIYEKQEELKQAENMYLKALDIDPDFFNARDKLIYLYYLKEKNYEKTIHQCDLVFSKYRFEIYKDNNPSILFQYFLTFGDVFYKSYIHLNRYEDAIKILLEKKRVINYIVKGNENYILSSDDAILYKLYCILKDEKGIAEMKVRWKNYYQVSDSYISGMEKDAVQGYILKFHDENYDIAPDGTFL